MGVVSFLLMRSELSHSLLEGWSATEKTTPATRAMTKSETKITSDMFQSGTDCSSNAAMTDGAHAMVTLRQAPSTTQQRRRRDGGNEERREGEREDCLGVLLLFVTAGGGAEEKGSEGGDERREKSEVACPTRKEEDNG